MSSVESNVSERYAAGAQQREAALCCPVDYDPQLLKILPTEIIERDYGCGDPSRYVQEGDTVLDLGSGGGKICYMAAQLVGPQGKVIGVDMTDEMLALARKYQPEMAQKIGADRVDFRKGYIQDLALDVEAMNAYLAANPVTDNISLSALESWKQQQRSSKPLIASESVDLVISNCVLNLVAEADRRQMIEDIFRVLKPGGRVAISDIVCDETVPQHLKDDATLWSGCISGAFQEKGFMDAFLAAGFVAVAYDKWDEAPWQVVEGIEFRSVTLVAVKPERSGLVDAGHAVIYKGPYSEVQDDLGNYYPRGERIAVSKRTFRLIANGPYQRDFIAIEPASPVDKGCFCLPAGSQRPAAESKGAQHGGAAKGSGCC
jgi:SAM-dependent methyltransferase